MRKLLYGQVGGTIKAFIGRVHRTAIDIDGLSKIVAGCFSASNPEANRETGEACGIAADRIYSDYKQMIAAESVRTEGKLDFIVICTPNNTHYEIAKAALENGFKVVSDKPLCFTSEQAEELCRIAAEKNLLTCVTYTYTGYNMVKQARQMIAEGKIGKILDVKGEYLQDWLHDKAYKPAEGIWRMKPECSGIANCVGDIGTHIEETVSFMTGLRAKRIAAVLDTFGQELDMNANMLVEFEGGVHGTFSCSQIAAGHYNGLAIRVFGTEGALEWEQEHPDFLKYTPKGQPTQIMTRAAHSTGHALDINRIPSGHPEGLTMAFANIYRSFAEAVLSGQTPATLAQHPEFDFPTVEDGCRGVKFIEACVTSSAEGGVWKEI